MVGGLSGEVGCGAEVGAEGADPAADWRPRRWGRIRPLPRTAEARLCVNIAAGSAAGPFVEK